MGTPPPGGITRCYKCGEDRKHYRVTGRTAYGCDHCGNHIYPLAGIGGVYHQSSQKYLQCYLNEYSFRYNRRDRGNLIFTSILERVAEKASSSPERASPMPPVAISDENRLV
jgi:hypothetical protein